jgi:hypothetical protein
MRSFLDLELFRILAIAVVRTKKSHYRQVLSSEVAAAAYCLKIIATGYGLKGPRIESRRRQDFFAPIQNGPGTHPGFCTMGNGSFLG